MNIGSVAKFLSFGEVTDASSEPGLYAWYLRLNLGKSNLESRANFLSALKRITQQTCYPSLFMQLQGHLGLKLEGTLNHIWYGHDDYPLSDSFQDIFDCFEERKIFSDILESTVPLLTGPLYIGVSKNLQIRLKQHTQLIQEYQEAPIQVPLIDSEESLDNDKSFAQRIVKRKINPNHLAVGIVYVSQQHLSQERIRKIIESAEMLLNRMYYPTLGRR